MNRSNELPVGTRAGNQTIVGSAPHRNGHRYYQVACDCGSVREISHQSLGWVKSCGCIKQPPRAKPVRHGLSRTHILQCFNNMHLRVRSFPVYTSKGITICPEWFDVIAFVAWARANGYVKGYSLDRIDNEKGYEPDNCRWVKPEDQRRNRDCALDLDQVEAIRTAAHYSNAYQNRLAKIVDRRVISNTMSNLVNGRTFPGVGIELPRPHQSTEDHDLSWFLEGMVANENAPIDPANTKDAGGFEWFADVFAKHWVHEA